MRSRLALVLGLVPLAAYAYACSSDSNETPPTIEDDGGQPPDRDSSTPEEDGSVEQDSGGGMDSGPTCVGNPLTMDGGGTGVDAGGATLITPVGAATFYDGPQWVPVGAGNLYFSDFNTSSLFRIAPAGGTPQLVRTVASAIGNGLRDGVILTASGGNIVQTQIDGGADASLPAAPATNVNDLVVGPGGNVYFTDPQYQSGGTTQRGVYRMTPAGMVTPIKNFGATARVNGIAYDPKTLTLYVGISNTFTIVKYTVAIDGSVSAATEMPFVTTPAVVDSPDGLAVDIGGNVWVAEADPTFTTQNGRIEVFSPTGQKLGQIPFPGQRPTGVAFGGADNKTLYVTTQTGVYRYASRCEGVP